MIRARTEIDLNRIAGLVIYRGCFDRLDPGLGGGDGEPGVRSGQAGFELAVRRVDAVQPPLAPLGCRPVSIAAVALPAVQIGEFVGLGQVGRTELRSLPGPAERCSQ